MDKMNSKKQKNFQININQ